MLRKFLLLIFLFFFLSEAQVSASDWYVSPAGSSSGDGTINSPWDLQTALFQPSGVVAGDTVNMRAGTYTGKFISNLNGASGSAILVRPYQSEAVKLDGYAHTTVAATINSAATNTSMTIQVTDATHINRSNYLHVDDEDMMITAINGNVVTVVRGNPSGCPASVCPSHSIGTAVHVTGNILEVHGSYTWFRDFEITSSDPNRVSQISDSNPNDMWLGEGLDVLGPYTKFINLVIHDTAQGIGDWQTATNAEYYGNIVYNNGWTAPDRGHGHALYSQNNTETKYYKENIFFESYSDNMSIYGSSNAFLNNFWFEGNVMFSGRQLFGGGAPMQNLTLKENFIYDGFFQLGYQSHANTGLTMTDNFFPKPIYIYWWTNIAATGNTFFYRNYSCPFNFQADGTDTSTLSFDHNTYYYNIANYPTGPVFCWQNTSLAPSDPNYDTVLYFQTDWQQSRGLDPNSSVVNVPPVTPQPSAGATMALSGSNIFLRPNVYDSTRANLIIYNWDLANSVSVDVSGLGWSSGDTYTLRNVLDYLNDIVSGTYDGTGSISVPMTGHTKANTLSDDLSLEDNTFPEFGVFLVQNTTVAASATASPTATPTPTATSSSSDSTSATTTPSPTPTPTSSSASGTSLPVTGGLEFTLFVAAGGFSLIGLGFFL
ncbi:MAG TPA: hypothetical protein VLH19_04460, partial [Patescibacteria group bacterium]|nr:hypothetical protein [Patescibacteria group bacterium]